MILTLEQLKAALGIAPEDVSQDVAVTNALAQANGLLVSYIGFDLSDTTTEREYQYTVEERPYWTSTRNFIHLPVWPVLEIIEVLDGDGNVVPVENYRLLKEQGRIDFTNGMPNGQYVTIRYRAGFDPVPAELLPVGINLATNIFNNGGSLSASTNALKSLTMFDAMSMSFDTGAGNSSTPMALLEVWDFVLGKYRVSNGPVLK